MVSITNSVNNTTGGSNSGATNTFTVTNSSNTASSQAQVNVAVGGSSSGDPYTTYTVTGTTNWSEGIDNSDSDKFVIASSTALGTSNVVTMTIAGAVSCVLGNFDVTKAASGADVSSTVSNTSNSASSTATQYLTVAGTSGGDARVQYAVAGTTTWTEGLDNSDSDAYVLAASNALGSTNVIRASTAGEINHPLQPCFLAYVLNDINNVTGDNTDYTIIFDTEVFDQNGDFNLGTSTFTAPVTGKYLFNFQVNYRNATGSFTFYVAKLTTSNRQYLSNNNGVVTSSDSQSVYTNIITEMEAGDTCTFIATVAGSTKTIDIDGTTTPNTFASGILIC